MLKDISTLEIQGANFVTMTPLAFFEPRDGNTVKTVKGSLLYGRNGTGKSTIAKAFRKVTGEQVPIIKQVVLLDKDSNPVTLSEDEKKSVRVFDEDYVTNQVKLKEDHLETIIMLGQAADLAEKIDKAEKDRDASKVVLDAKESAFNEYRSASNPKSPKYCLYKIGNALRGDDAWAGRDAKLRAGARQNTPVRDDTYKQFINRTPTKNKTELLVEFSAQMHALEEAKAGSSKIETKVPSIPNFYEQYNDQAIVLLLGEKIEKPELSEREQFLLGLIEAGQATKLREKADFFRNEENKECPFCFQPISDIYKADLVSSIEKVLSKTVSDHQMALERQIYEDLAIDISLYSALENYKSIDEQIATINTAIQKNNTLIRQKKENPFLPIESSDLRIASAISNLKEGLQDLEKERIEYNKQAVDTRPIIKKLNEINSDIAYYDVKEPFAELEKQQKEYANAEKEFNEANTDYINKQNIVLDLEAQRKNVQVALSILNACLKYIFFAEDRLKIEYTDGEYKLYSHGKSVRPCDVSVGERNIIGLCYFFTSILEGQEEKDAYGKEYLLVIDDPVSSFDTENRIGILSFIKYILSLFLKGNENTKALIMTHDLMTFYDTHKIFEEIVASCKKKGYALTPKYNEFEMIDGAIEQFRYKSRQEYTELLKTIFSYGKGQANEHDIVIGNMIRQALEAFSTFQYKKSIIEVSTDEEILSLLPEPEYQSYYKNLMYRLVLHGGSHREEQIKTMSDFGFFGLITEKEKRRTAKEVLCFIYLLDQHHVLQHLKEIGNAETTLNTWCNDIKARAAIP